MGAIAKIFEYKEDKESGSMGWGLKNAPPEFNAEVGLLVAHDTLEHFPNTTGSWEDELMALGAVAFIRGESGYFSDKYYPLPQDNISVDVANCFYFFLGSRRDIKPLKKTRGLNNEFEANYIISEAVNIALNQCRDETGDRPSLSTIANVTEWLKLGYRKSKRRYRGVESHEMLCLFTSIQRDVDDLEHQAEEGCELRVSVDVTNQTVDVKLTHPYYEW